MQDDDGDLVYWFKVEEDEDGGESLCTREPGGPDDEGDTIALTGITMKSFEAEEGSKFMCPECASDECEYIKGDIVDDALDEDGWMEGGYDPFGDPSDGDDEEDSEVK